MTPEESVPMHRRPPQGAILAVWVIYDHPKDFPQGYVLRAQYVMDDSSIKADAIAWYADDPDKLRSILPPGLFKLMPAPQDDVTIMETWL